MVLVECYMLWSEGEKERKRTGGMEIIKESNFIIPMRCMKMKYTFGRFMSAYTCMIKGNAHFKLK